MDWFFIDQDYHKVDMTHGRNSIMTGMLASVSSLPEAQTAAAAGVDIIDFKNPLTGALGALPPATLRTIKTMLDPSFTTSATVGDLPMDPELIHTAVAVMAETGVDYVKVGLFDAPNLVDCIVALRPLCASGVRIVCVLFADENPDLDLLPQIAENGCVGVMLDTANKTSGGLPTCMTPAQLADFVTRAHKLHLLTGLAGSLRAEDIPKLLPLRVDYLGFRGALCVDAARTRNLSPAAVARIRALIPRSSMALRAVS